MKRGELKVGDRVRGQSGGKGVVVRVRADGDLDVKWDDGQTTTGEPFETLKKYERGDRARNFAGQVVR